MTKSDFENMIARLDEMATSLKSLDTRMATIETTVSASASTASTSSAGKKGVTKKRIVDPNAPKRPLNWIFLLRSETYKEIADKYNGTDTSIDKIKKEKQTTYDERKVDAKYKTKYEKIAKKLSEQYKKDVIAYKLKVNDIKATPIENDSEDDIKEKINSGNNVKDITVEADDDSEDDIKSKINSSKNKAEALKISELANAMSDDSD